MQLVDRVYLGQTVSTDYRLPCLCAPHASWAPTSRPPWTVKTRKKTHPFGAVPIDMIIRRSRYLRRSGQKKPSTFLMQQKNRRKQAPSLSLSLCFSLPLSRALSLAPIKGGFGLFGASLSPPGFEPSPTGQKRCGVSTGPRRWVICTMAPCAPLFVSFLSPPVMRIFFRMGVCSAVCRGTAQRPRVPGPLA